MTRIFLECAIRAALIVIGTAIVLYAMRVKVAAVKHRVWTAVLVLMLALPAWTAWGPKAELRLLPAAVQRFAGEPIATPVVPADSASQPAATPANIAQPRQRLFNTTEEILLGIYLLGGLMLLARLMIGTAKASRLIRDAALVDGIMTSSACVAPVTVGCLRPTVILPRHWREWTRKQLDVVLAHEGEHVRRRDPLVQWLALFNRAIFWFHPAAWWLERELSALAEEACDAAVIAQGHDPDAYAETLMKIARDVMDSGSRINSVAVAMPGPRLTNRICGIVGRRAFARISRLRAACTIAVCAALSVALLAVTLARAQDTATDDWEKAAGGKMSFDVASVKQDTAGLPPAGPATYSNFPLFAGSVFPPNGGRMSITNLDLMHFIVFAYKLGATEANELPAQLPKWALEDRFDIEARAPEGTTKDQMRLMMQSLLAERFKFATHWEMVQQPVYDLVFIKPGKFGSQLRPHSIDDPCAPSPAAVPAGGNSPESRATIAGGFPSVCGGIMPLDPSAPELHRIGARGISMTFFAKSFGGSEATAVDRPIVDKTGITGTIDFVLEYYRLGDNSPEVLPGPTFLEAIKDQLGLKLQPGTSPVSQMVIDHVERPTAN